MKKWKNYLLSVLAVAGFVACSDDDPGMAPLIDGSDVNIELKRDTADTYRISLPITSEEGVAKVSLIDNATKNAINEQTSFSNPNSFTYTYDLDLTTYTENTVLMLTLQIEDKAGQIVSKKINLTIQKFSELDVRFGAEGTISTWFENCNVKLTVIRGMIPLKELQVYVGETLSNTFDLSLDPEQSRYDLNVRVEGLKDGSNTVKVVVIDNKDQKFEKSITIAKTAKKTWEDVIAASCIGLSPYGSIPIEFNDQDLTGENPVDYPVDGRIYRVGILGADMMSGYYVDFEYGNNGMVSKAKSWYLSMFTGEGSVEYSYTYNDDNEVTKVTRSENGGAASDYVTDIVYESGSIKSYKIGGSLYTPQYIEKDGEMIRVDLLDKDLSGFCGDFTTKYGNPFFMDKLPALIPLEVNGLDFCMFFYNPYFFETVKDNNTEIQSYNVSGIVYDSDMEVNAQSISWTLDNKEMMIKYYYKD